MAIPLAPFLHVSLMVIAQVCISSRGVGRVLAWGHLARPCRATLAQLSRVHISCDDVVSTPSVRIISSSTRKCFTPSLIALYQTKEGRFKPEVGNLENDDGEKISFGDNVAASRPLFQPGDPIQVEVISFGPLGATVHVIGLGHDPSNLLPDDDQIEPYGKGLILQREIHYFREARNRVDVVRGEVLPAYVERIREDEGQLRLDISLRVVGGKAKTDQLGPQILEMLEQTPTGTLPIGDKSSPEEIARLFPGVSKASFKKAVAALYKQGKVQPGPDFISLITSYR